MKTKSFLFIVLLLLGSFTNAADGAIAASMEVTGKAKFSGLLQTWYVNDTTTGSDVQQNFKIRRAEMKFAGSVAENTKWFVMIDAAKTPDTSNDAKVLQDLGFGFSLFPYLEVTVGQMKTPSNWESSRSSGDLLLPERSMVTRRYGDRRDIGAMFNYSFLASGKIAVMFSNGANANGKSTNIDETNTSKDVNGRAEYEFPNAIKAGVYGGSQVYGTLGATKTKTIVGGDLVYELDPLFAAVDYVSAKDNNVDDAGEMVTLGYKIFPNLQLVLRYDLLTTGATPVNSEVASASLNYLIAKTNSEIQVSYSGMKNAKGSGGQYTIDTVNKNGDLVNIAFLSKF